jgi:transposase InsO family protein
MYPQYGVGNICRLFGKTRQGWYEQCERKEDQSLKTIMVIKLVEEIRHSLPRVGTRKLLHILQADLEAHNIKLGRDKLYEILGEHGLLLRYRKRKHYTTDSNHPYRKYPNLIREMILTSSGELMVSDITYLRLTQGFCYLSIITDAYSRKIIGHQLHPTLSSEGAIQALKTALSTLKGKHHPVHHSDRGVQYCCNDYVKTLELNNIKISMTEKGDPYENAIAERVNGIMKTEFGLDKTFTSISQAIETTNEAINAYNYKRPHASCDYLTPVVAHEQNGILRKRWKQPSKPILETIL